MKEKTNIMSWLIPILMTVGGIVVMIRPGESVKAAYTVAGLALIACGVVGLVMMLKAETGKEKLNGIKYFLLLLVGAVIMINPAPVASIIPILIGILFIAIGVLNLFKAIALRGTAPGKVLLVFALLALVFGILIVWNPFDSARVFAAILGIGMTCAGISMLTGGIKFKTVTIEIDKEAKKKQPSSFVDADYEVETETGDAGDVAAEAAEIFGEGDVKRAAETVDDMDLATAVMLANAEEADAVDLDD